MIMLRRNFMDKQKAFRNTDFSVAPKCKHQRLAKTSKGLEIRLCEIKKGEGLKKNYCGFVGQEIKCPYYKSKYKIGRDIYDMLYDFI